MTLSWYLNFSVPLKFPFLKRGNNNATCLPHKLLRLNEIYIPQISFPDMNVLRGLPIITTRAVISTVVMSPAFPESSPLILAQPSSELAEPRLG